MEEFSVYLEDGYMVSDKFRYQLRQEAEKWQAEGLINQSQYELISQRYQFNTLDASARYRFIVIIIGLGSLLLGLAVITFVAANWQYLSRELRVLLLLSIFVGVNTAGFYLWRYPTEQWQNRLGRGLLLLGALILGANMALMSQMFHQSGSPAGLYIVWGIGVLAMAYTPPANLPANQVVLKGRLRYGTINYGLETYYFPEDQREQFNKDISQAQTGVARSQFVVEVKVDSQGNSVPVSLWVRDRNYRF